MPSPQRGGHSTTERRSPFRQLVDLSPDAILVVDRDGRIRQANPAAAALFGDDHLRGGSAHGLFPDEPLSRCPEQSRRESTGRPKLELTGRRRDLSRFPAEVTVIPIESSDGPLAVVTVRDVTEARRTQAILERTLGFLVSSNRDRQLLLAHLVRAQEDERKRIAAGIHDDTIQVMSAAHLRLQQLRNRLRDRAEAGIADKLEDALQLSLTRLRQLVFDLRPSGLDEGNLSDSLRSTLEAMHSATGIAYELEDELATTVPAATALLIYRTAREALVNVRKHARASSVRVELADLDNGYLVRIADDGVGYDPAHVENRPGHVGLLLMRERPQLAGGYCVIESMPGAGTSVVFWVPAEPAVAAEIPA